MATLSSFLIERLINSGIKTIMGIPGEFISQLYSQLSKSFSIVNCTTEANAGHAADAYSRLNGIGCVITNCGSGNLKLINSVACAFAEKSPLIVISGCYKKSQLEIFKHVTCTQAILNDLDSAGFEIDRVLYACKHYKQPVYLEIPCDVIDKTIRYDAFSRGTPVSPKSDPAILEESLAEIKELIAGAKRPVIWAGIEIARHGFGTKLINWAEINKIPVATTILGKGIVNEEHQLSLGVYCEYGSSDELKKYMSESNLICLGIMESGNYGQKLKNRELINISTGVIQARRHFYKDVIFQEFIEGLFKIKLKERNLTAIPSKTTNINDKFSIVRFFSRLGNFITDKSILISDVGDSLYGCLDIKIKNVNHFISDAFYLSLGFSLPAAIGVICAKPESRPIVLMGNNAFLTSGQEFATLVKMKSTVTVFILTNSIENGIERIELDYVKIAEGFGGIGIKCKTEVDLESALLISQNTKNRPVLIEICFDKEDISPFLKRLKT